MTEPRYSTVHRFRWFAPTPARGYLIAAVAAAAISYALTFFRYPQAMAIVGTACAALFALFLAATKSKSLYDPVLVLALAVLLYALDDASPPELSDVFLVTGSLGAAVGSIVGVLTTLPRRRPPAA